VGLLTAERAEIGVPFTPDLTDGLLAAPFALGAVGVEERAGVRFAGAGEDEVLVATSRAGVPGGAGFLAVCDILVGVDN
jgi:hypothetical protein